MRSDTERNRRRLIRAAAYLVARHGRAVKMTDVAERAEVSTATAYRHFGSVEEIVAEFRSDVGRQLFEFSSAERSTGVARLRAVCGEWVRLTVKHGGAMVHTRSEDGYLQRLRAGAGYLSAQAEALAEPIASATAELGFPDPGDIGLFLWNILFDPREIFDLRDTELLDDEQITERLTGAFLGALQGWSNRV